MIYCGLTQTRFATPTCQQAFLNAFIEKGGMRVEKRDEGWRGVEKRKRFSPPLPSPSPSPSSTFFGGKGGGSDSNFHATACMQILANAGLSLSELLSLFSQPCFMCYH